MKRLVCVAVLVACGSGGDSALRVPQPLVFERYSPPQPASYDVFVAARGQTVVMASRISLDGGASWRPLDARLGTPSRVALDDTGLVSYAPGVGLARYELASGAMSPIAAPPFTSDRTWRRDPNGALIIFDPVGNQIAMQGAAAWRMGALPAPGTECCPYITDVESNGRTLLSVSGWGVHRSRDNGASWQLAAAPIAGAGRDLLVLPDGRFLLVGGAASYLFTADGAAAGSLPALVDDNAAVCDDGGIVANGQVSHDLGVTWQPLVGAGMLPVIVERAGCGGGAYWVLLRSDAWGYRLVRLSAPGAPGVAVGNWDAVGPQAWLSSGPSIVRTADGTFLAGGLAWRDGDAAWTLREMPARTWSDGGALFGDAGGALYLSRDAGLTWSRLEGLTATPDAFAYADGALYVSQYGGGSENGFDSWRADVWRSSDLGATWSVAYHAVATRPVGGDITGEAHRFVGITGGTWVATDAVSADGGASWQATNAVGDRSIAHLTPDGDLVMQPADAAGEVWRVYADGGAGELLATHKISADTQPVLAADLRSVAFDADGYAYVARGTPAIQIWRSTTPVQLPTRAR